MKAVQLMCSALVLKRAISGTCFLLGKPISKAELRKVPRTCSPDFTRCRGAAPLEGEEDPVLGPDEEYPDWLWELADQFMMPIDERLKKPDHSLFRKIEHFRQSENKRVLRLRNTHPGLYSDLKFPTEDEIIDTIRQHEKKRSENIEDGRNFAQELREKASSELRHAIHTKKTLQDESSDPIWHNARSKIS